MNRNFPELLKKYRRKRGLSQAGLGEAIGGDQTEISRYERGVRLPSRDKLVALSKALRLSVDMLAGGEGTAQSPVSVVYRAGSLPKDVAAPRRRSEQVEVPLVDDVVAARPGRVVDEKDVKDWVWILRSQLGPAADHDLVCVYVKDNAMAPAIPEGAVACLDRDDKPMERMPSQSDGVYAVQMKPGSLIFRHVAAGKDELTLIPAKLGRDGSPILSVKKKRGSPAIIGRVVWIGLSLGCQAE